MENKPQNEVKQNESPQGELAQGDKTTQVTMPPWGYISSPKASSDLGNGHSAEDAQQRPIEGDTSTGDTPFNGFSQQVSVAQQAPAAQLPPPGQDNPQPSPGAGYANAPSPPSQPWHLGYTTFPTTGATTGGGGNSTKTTATHLSGRLWAILVLVSAIVGGLVGAGVAARYATDGQQTIVEKFFPSKSIAAGSFNSKEIFAKVAPEVVFIKIKAFAGNNLFGGGQFVEGAGSGMIISSNGLVVTNNHVVAGATTVQVRLYGQTQYRPATVIGTDPSNDVALVQIQNVKGLPTVSFGNSANIGVASNVLAIGNALNLAGGPTVTQGIISAEGRSITAADPITGSTETLNNLLQTSAAINPGNSGGPLVDSSGQVIGMNTAVAQSGSGSGAAQNIGFAIPSDTIKGLLPSLEKGGIVTSGQAFLGVGVVSLTSSLRQQYGLTPTSGALVSQIYPGTAAYTAGLQVLDVIVSLNSTTIKSASDLTTALSKEKPGDRVTLGIYRGASKFNVTVVLGTKPAGLP
ncbi:MAG: trypsin-like peptidase domain-containing protein [Actinobacteria bacterium]|nr:trypsin-like peptidase domain-containing protein [Actinomycetota bacterium]MCL6104544.1 trypsin-like peptidase domain-containing protein [Actinomycetota bacterium]